MVIYGLFSARARGNATRDLASKDASTRSPGLPVFRRGRRVLVCTRVVAAAAAAAAAVVVDHEPSVIWSAASSSRAPELLAIGRLGLVSCRVVLCCRLRRVPFYALCSASN